MKKETNVRNNGLDYEGLLEKEYDTLVNAHFQTSQRITSFFQYALLIFSAPITFIVSIANNSENSSINNFMGYIAVVVGLVGFFVTRYLTQLRVESLMYARYINKIRSIVYSKQKLDTSSSIDLEKRTILFSQFDKPKFSDIGQFINVNFALGFLNSLYISIGVYFFAEEFVGFFEEFISIDINWPEVVIGAFVISSLLQLVVLCADNHRNESGSYYYRKDIGIDIDGVIGEHRSQFAKFIMLLYGNEINPESIVDMPVYKNNLVTKSEHDEVFKCLDYWETMPLLPKARHNIQALKKLGYRIIIYTSRHEKITRSSAELEICCRNIKEVTKEWLSRNQIKYDKIYFDKLNNQHNRTKHASKKRVLYFIEDNLDNAIKLSKSCKYVFLVDQPYNQESKTDHKQIPFNVIRVESWDEIYRVISEWD